MFAKRWATGGTSIFISAACKRWLMKHGLCSRKWVLTASRFSTRNTTDEARCSFRLWGAFRVCGVCGRIAPRDAAAYEGLGLFSGGFGGDDRGAWDLICRARDCFQGQRIVF